MSSISINEPHMTMSIRRKPLERHLRAPLFSRPIALRSMIFFAIFILVALDETFIGVSGELGHRREEDSTFDRKPNILFLMTDQQRFDMIRYVQDRLQRYDSYLKINTPNMDMLLESGVYFENAYCQCPVCGPARTSLRTGLTIERSGIQHNDLVTEYKNHKGTTFEKRVNEMVSIDEVLTQQLNYTTSQYFGKYHIPDVLAKNIEYNDYNYTTGEFFFKYEGAGRKLKRYLQHATTIGEIPLITDDFFLEGEQLDTYSDYPYYPIDLDTRARHNSSTNTPLKESEGFQTYEIGQSNVMGLYSLGERHTSSSFTGEIAGKALKILMKEQKKEGDPWFLTVSFHSPHPPMIAPWKYLKKYWSKQTKLFSPKGKNMNDDGHMNDTSYNTITEKIPEYGDERMILEWTAVYYALIEEVDDQIGKLLSILNKDEYIKNNTLVVFTSDHGEMLGSHGKRDKNNFFEESSRVPLFMSYPSKIEPGTHVKDLVGHIDIFETILDYASSPGSMSSSQGFGSDGVSLRPLIEGAEVNKDHDNNFIVSEWDFRKPTGASSFDRRIDERPSFLVRKGSYKLMIHKIAATSELDMFYDLETDPYEIHNLIGKNSSNISTSTLSKVEHLRCLLLDWMKHRNDGINGKGYFNDPEANFGEGQGDMSEIRSRQPWNRLDFWISDERIDFGSISASKMNNFVRHEHVYFGTRNENASVFLKSALIVGEDSTFFHLPEELSTPKFFGFGECASLRISLVFRGNPSRDVFTTTQNISASLILLLQVTGQAAREVRVELRGSIEPIPPSLPSDFDIEDRIQQITGISTIRQGQSSREEGEDLGEKFDFSGLDFTGSSQASNPSNQAVEEIFFEFP